MSERKILLPWWSGLVAFHYHGLPWASATKLSRRLILETLLAISPHMRIVYHQLRGWKTLLQEVGQISFCKLMIQPLIGFGRK